MADQELLKSLSVMPEVGIGFQLLREAVGNSEATGFLNHSSNSDNTLTYYAALRHEVHALFCTADKRYAEQRRNLERTGLSLVAFLSGTITMRLGAPAGVATPLAALALFLPLKLGVNAWCKLYKSSPEQVTPDEWRVQPPAKAPRRKK